MYAQVDDDHGQPPEWEAQLEDVTVPRCPDEVLFDPTLMETALAAYGEAYRHVLACDPTTLTERWAEIERLRAIAKRKLSGEVREVMLLFLTGRHSYRSIARHLGLAKDTVRRQIARAGKLLREHTEPPAKRTFPSPEQGTLNAAILPLDTNAERQAFMTFINRHHPVSVAYGGDGDFREALVVYIK